MLDVNDAYKITLRFLKITSIWIVICNRQKNQLQKDRTET